MVNCQNNRVTTQKVLESYIGEILETLQNHKDVWRLLQTNFFHFCAKFQAILLDFWNFQKFRDEKEIGKILESLAISSNLSVVHHK